MEATGVPAWQPVAGLDWHAGGLLATATAAMKEAPALALVLTLTYFLAINAFYLVLLVMAALEMAAQRLRAEGRAGRRLLSSPVAPSISLIAPAYNEEVTVEESLRSLLALNYPNLEVILVNDGSRDRTMDVLTERFDLVPVHPIFRRVVESKPVRGIYRSKTFAPLVVVDKENGGKADALNAGLNLASSHLVCAIDADTLIELDSLLRMARPFIESPDLLAAGGTIRVANGCMVRHGRVVEAHVSRRPLEGFQTVEYLRAFLFGRLGWNRLGGNLVISGAFGLFRRDAVLACGGYQHDTVGEDMELVLRLRARGYESGGPSRVDFVPDPVAWTEVPETTRVLGRQRDRWHRGLADVMWRYRRACLNPRYRAMGLVAIPYFLFFELLAPPIEAVGLVGLAIGIATRSIDWSFVALFFAVAYGLGMILTVGGLLLEEFAFHRYSTWQDRGLLLLWAALEDFGYHQLTVWWRLKGLWKFLRGRRDWGAMERRGLGRPAA